MRSQTIPLLMIAVGTVFLLTNLGIIPMSQVKALLRDWWPLVLIIVGVLQLIKK